MNHHPKNKNISVIECERVEFLRSNLKTKLSTKRKNSKSKEKERSMGREAEGERKWFGPEREREPLLWWRELRRKSEQTKLIKETRYTSDN